MLVSEVMTHEVITVAEEDSLHGLADLLDAHDFRQFPVVDNDRYVGMLNRDRLQRSTLSSMISRSLSEADQLDWEQQTFVASILQNDVPTVDPQTTVADVAEIILYQNLPALPVVDSEDVLIGIISRQDILRVAVVLIEKLESANHQYGAWPARSSY